MMTSGGGLGPVIREMPTYEPDVVNAIFGRVDVSCPKEINARFISSRLGQMSLIRSVHDSRNCSSRRLERHMSDADNGNYYACMPLDGGLRIHHLGRHCELGQGELGIVATSAEYEIEMSDRLDALWLRVPTRLLRAHVISMDDLLGYKVNVSGGVGAAAMDLMRAAIREGNTLSARGESLIAHALVSFIGETINSARDDDSARASRHRRRILERARDYIEAHIAEEGLTPQQIAKGVGISTRYLSEIFAAEGTSPMRWVRNRRLERCRMELEQHGGNQQLIREVAYSMGFVNISSFNRAFKAQFGESPRALMQKPRGRWTDDEK